MVSQEIFKLQLESALILFFSALITLAGITIIKGWESVPENEEWIIELNGKYMATWKAGLHISFPFGNLMVCRNMVSMMEIGYPLFTKSEGDDSKTEVDFHDVSAQLKSFVNFRVYDSLIATYAIDDYETASIRRIEGALRSTCGLYNLDEANMDKHLMDLPSVIIHHEEVEGVKGPGKVASTLSTKKRLAIISGVRQLVVANKKDYKNRPFYTEFLGWGVEVKKLTVEDIIIPERIQTAREGKLIAAERLEATIIENDITRKNAAAESDATISKAIGDSESVRKTGKALADKIKALVDSAGLSPQEASEMIVAITKWESLSDKTVVLENSLSDSMTKRFVELGLLSKIGSDVVKP
ncbi:MAG: SPFH domain-containing protein [Patescibacteria group bacterium]